MQWFILIILVFENGFTEGAGAEDSSKTCQETHSYWEGDSDSDYDDTDDPSAAKIQPSNPELTPQLRSAEEAGASAPAIGAVVAITPKSCQSDIQDDMRGKKIVHIHDFS